METFSRVIFCTLHLRLPRCSRWQHTHVAKSEFDHMSEFDDLWKRIQGDSMPELLGEALEQSAPPKNHAGRVTAFAIAIARHMGLPTEETLVIARGAYLHDIGKMAIPHAILLKPAALTPEETAMMREHCLLGYKIVQKFPLLGGADEIVHSHHERYDGTGYPSAEGRTDTAWGKDCGSSEYVGFDYDEPTLPCSTVSGRSQGRN
jgi:putative nucleotidyltransferase with HDIG domain